LRLRRMGCSENIYIRLHCLTARKNQRIRVT
jgi:hypothetical protein